MIDFPKSKKFTCPKCKGHHFSFAGETVNGLLIRYCPNQVESLASKIKRFFFPNSKPQFITCMFTFTDNQDYLYFN